MIIALPPPAPPSPSLLTPADLALLARLVPATNPGSRSSGRGLFRAARPGRSHSFYDHRPYSPGDSPAEIDWKAWGRSDRLLVRRGHRETDQAVQLVIDASASMGFTGFDRPQRRAAAAPRRRSTFHVAARLALGLAWVHLRHTGPVGLSFAGGQTTRDLKPAKPPTHLARLADALSQARPAGEANLAETLDRLASQQKKLGRVILLSDLHEPAPPLLSALARLRGRGVGTEVVHLTHHAVLKLPAFDEAVLVDLETGRRKRTDLASLRPGLTRRAQSAEQAWRRILAARQIAYFTALTSDPPAEVWRRILTGSRG